MSFHIYTAIADDVTERLESGILDMGLLLEPVEISRYRYIRMPLEERWSVLMRKDSILAEKERIAPGDLAGVPLILAKRQSVRNKLENWFGRSAKDMRVVCTCNLSHHNMMDMVESGMGAAMTMDFSCDRSDLCIRPIEPELTSGCVLVWKKNLKLSLVMLRFIAHVNEALGKE